MCFPRAEAIVILSVSAGPGSDQVYKALKKYLESRSTVGVGYNHAAGGPVSG